MRIEMPEDVEREIQRSKDFSKAFKKKCGQYGLSNSGTQLQQVHSNKKMKTNEILQMQEEANHYLVITPEMQQLEVYVKKTTQWVEKANAVREQVVTVKTLQNLVQESRSIPVNFEHLLDEIKKRYGEAQSLVDKIHSTFTKVSKTRTQIANKEGSKQSTDKKATNEKGSPKRDQI